MKIQVRLMKTFTKDKDAGNPAGVVANANKLSDEQILKITQELGFGESAFLQKSDQADYKIRLFSVKGEVKSCVTATVAAAYTVLKGTEKQLISFETKLGVRNLYRKSDNLILMKQPKVEFSETFIDRKKVMQLLNISKSQLLDYPMEIGSVGTPKLLIPIKSLSDLFAIKPDLNNIAQYCNETGIRGFYPFTLETKNKTSDFHARQFNPLAGISEDPVTGVAAAVLAEYLRKYSIIKKEHLIGEQGYIIDKPGEIIIEVDGENIYVGGYVIEFGTGDVDL